MVVLDGGRAVVPKPARRELLKLLHLGHTGMTKTYMAAKDLYYWPCMKNEIQMMIAQCPECLEHLPSQGLEPLRPLTPATAPMDRVSVDFFDAIGKKYLLMVDQFSGYPLVAEMRSTTSSATCAQLTTWFLRFGYPRTVRSDNGPQFTSAEFEEWCKSHYIRHETSSPHFQSSNGLAEVAV